MSLKHLIILLFFLIILFSGCFQPNTVEEKKTLNGKKIEKTIVKEKEFKRTFLLGIVPNPKFSKTFNFNNLINAIEESSKLVDVVMVWTGTNIGQFEKLKQNRVIEGLRVFGLKTVITLNFATIKQVKGKGLVFVIDAPSGMVADLKNEKFRNAWKKEAKNLAQNFKPEYFSLGNELNDYFYLHPEQLDDFFSLFEETFDEIKKVSPNTKVFVVFSYNHLIENNQWNLIEKFEKKADLIGLTTYPWKNFDNPNEIEEDYYSRIKNYTNKPIAFTEIGWVSSEQDNSSEKEQAEFFEKFLILTKELDIEMVNWLFLHEAQLDGMLQKITNPSTQTIALKKVKATKKQIYQKWVELKKLKISK